MNADTGSALWSRKPSKLRFKDAESGTNNSFHRPIPIRTRTFSQSSPTEPSPGYRRGGFRSRHKSVPFDEPFSPRHSLSSTSIQDHDSPRSSLDENTGMASDCSPPASPSTAMTEHSSRNSFESNAPDLTPYDFSRVDYELERAKLLGQGLWSNVFLAQHKISETVRSPQHAHLSTRARNMSSPSLYAVKTPSRRDSKDIFSKEAKVLTFLQRRHSANEFIIPFYGLDVRNNSLVFEAVIGGSLENLISRLKQMTEHARHLEIVNLFPSLASDLISGLDFLHSAGVVHADIKTANILLDISQRPSSSTSSSGGNGNATGGSHVVRARYIDFSAAYIPSHPSDPQLSSSSNAGGTWEFMAPEQLRIQAGFDNSPTPASDVWSLAVTLLSVLVGGSPFAGAVAPGNVFMLREAVKSGDPLRFARADPVSRKRLDACQDFVDCLRLALRKDADIRVSAAGWKMWVAEREMGL